MCRALICVFFFWRPHLKNGLFCMCFVSVCVSSPCCYHSNLLFLCLVNLSSVHRGVVVPAAVFGSVLGGNPFSQWEALYSTRWDAVHRGGRVALWVHWGCASGAGRHLLWSHHRGQLQQRAVGKCLQYTSQRRFVWGTNSFNNLFIHSRESLKRMRVGGE